MSKRIVTLKLIVDMENIQCDEWVDPNDFLKKKLMKYSVTYKL